LLFAFFVFLIFDCFLLLFCLSSFCILCPMLPMYRNLSILALIAPSDFSNVYSSSSPVSLPIPFCCDTYWRGFLFFILLSCFYYFGCINFWGYQRENQKP
jgi:hypothetical protein